MTVRDRALLTEHTLGDPEYAERLSGKYDWTLTISEPMGPQERNGQIKHQRMHTAAYGAGDSHYVGRRRNMR